MEQNTDQNYGTVEDWNPATFAVKANTDDNPNWGQAINGPLAEGYWQACIKEYETLVKMDVCEEVEREGWMNILPGAWAFKCKRFPDGLVRKLNARFCAMGNHQVENFDYFETFTPVVTWNTVRILLTMSLLLKLATKQVDYTAAFVHAPIDKPPGYDEMTGLEKEQSSVYIEMPRSFAEEKSGKVLKLSKSLYGLKQSPRNFFLFLKGNLEAVGLQQSEADPCLFVNNKVICLVYVDGTLFFAKEMSGIDDLIEDLEKTMVLEVEDDVAGFLGVHIDRRDDGTINLTQTGLIERIITDVPAKRTPAEVGCLGKDLDGDPCQSTFSYPSVIGQLQYLQGHSRPDIATAVSQSMCALYAQPKTIPRESAHTDRTVFKTYSNSRTYL
jgi:hypothetical protein